MKNKLRIFRCYEDALSICHVASLSIFLMWSVTVGVGRVIAQESEESDDAVIPDQSAVSADEFKRTQPQRARGKQTPYVWSDTAPVSDVTLWDEAMATVDNPRIYDWRRASWELDLAYLEVDDRTVFQSSGYQLGIGFPMQGGWVVRGGLRRIFLNASPSGDLIETTPFRQTSQPTRYEVYGLVDWSLAEGHLFTRLSPLLGDSEHVLALQAGAHYVHPSAKVIPTREGDYDRVNGQQVGFSTWVIDGGLRYTMYLPQGVGLFMAPSIQFPVSKIEGSLFRWYTFTVGAVYSFNNQVERRPYQEREP